MSFGRFRARGEGRTRRSAQRLAKRHLKLDISGLLSVVAMFSHMDVVTFQCDSKSVKDKKCALAWVSSGLRTWAVGPTWVFLSEVAWPVVSDP